MRSFLKPINEKSLTRYGNDPILEARIKSYEIAARMQMSVPEVTELNGRPERRWTRMESIRWKRTVCGRRCLLARRLIERGVRFVLRSFPGGRSQEVRARVGMRMRMFSRTIQRRRRKSISRWRPDSRFETAGLAGGYAALVHHGVRKDSVRTVGGGSGRSGGDHNRYAFSIFAVGAGLKPGTAHGATDDIGWKVTEKPVTWHDFHATILHCSASIIRG